LAIFGTSTSDYTKIFTRKSWIDTLGIYHGISTKTDSLYNKGAYIYGQNFLRDNVTDTIGILKDSIFTGSRWRWGADSVVSILRISNLDSTYNRLIGLEVNLRNKLYDPNLQAPLMFGGYFNVDTVGSGLADGGYRYGVFGKAHGGAAETLSCYGVFGDAEMEEHSAGRLYGVYGMVHGGGYGKKYAVFADANENNYGVETPDSLFGVYSWINHSAVASRPSFAGYFLNVGQPGDTCFGIYANASGGDKNFAGYFLGNTCVQSGNFTINNSSFNRDFIHVAMNQEGLADTGVYFPKRSYTTWEDSGGIAIWSGSPAIMMRFPKVLEPIPESVAYVTMGLAADEFQICTEGTSAANKDINFYSRGNITLALKSRKLQPEYGNQRIFVREQWNRDAIPFESYPFAIYMDRPGYGFGMFTFMKIKPNCSEFGHNPNDSVRVIDAVTDTLFGKYGSHGSGFVEFIRWGILDTIMYQLRHTTGDLITEMLLGTTDTTFFKPWSWELKSDGATVFKVDTIVGITGNGLINGHQHFTGTCIIDTVVIRGVSDNSIVTLTAKGTTGLNGGLSWAYLNIDSIIVACIAADTAQMRTNGYCWKREE